MSERQACAVVGSGAWGTTLAAMLCRLGNTVRLWARRQQIADEVNTTHRNSLYLEGIDLPAELSASTSIGEVVEAVDTIIYAVPSVWLRSVAASARDEAPPDALVICATKGMERESGKRMSQVLAEELRLSRPETRLLNNDLFRVYTNCDIIGVEFAGALKNVIAIGGGLSDGLGFGDNAKASLITRGLAEICRLGHALGAMPGTFWGIAGVGDLIATCSSRLSRNWTLGYRLGRGESVGDVLGSMHSVAEGYYTTHAAARIATELGIDAPITHAIYGILYEGGSPPDVARGLMSRRQRAEHEEWHGPVVGNW
jgi:glycerol-3-phosphate dehydrogenase (NAD(P)+)